MRALKREPQYGDTEGGRGIEKSSAEKSLSTLETREVISQMEGVSKNIPGGLNSKSKGTEIRRHGVFSDLEGSCDSLAGQYLLRG